MALEDAPVRLGQSPRAADATSELRTTVREATACFARAVAGLAEQAGDLVHMDLLALLYGTEKAFVPGPSSPLRLVPDAAALRRTFPAPSPSTTHRSCAATGHYSRFGVEQVGIRVPVPVHLDLEASWELAHLAGWGVWAVDSVSELHISALADFLAALSEDDGAALADEEQFVDRPHSVLWCAREIVRLEFPERSRPDHG